MSALGALVKISMFASKNCVVITKIEVKTYIRECNVLWKFKNFVVNSIVWIII